MNSKNLVLLLLVFTLFSCRKIDEFTQFNMEYEQEVVIESGAGINLPFNVLTPDVETNSSSTFAVNDTRKDLVESITLESLVISIESPSGEDFSFLESIEIFLAADGLNEQKIAWNTDVAANADSPLTLNVSDADLQEYIKKDEFSLRLNTVTDEFLTQDYTLNVSSDFYVDAKVLGQ